MKVTELASGRKEYGSKANGHTVNPFTVMFPRNCTSRRLRIKTALKVFVCLFIYFSFLGVRAHNRNYTLLDFEVHKAVLLTAGPMLHSRSLELSHLV